MGSKSIRPAFVDAIPFVTSLVVHLGFVLLAVLTYKVITVVVERQSVAPAVIPGALSEIAPEFSSLPQFRGLENDPDRRAGQEQFAEVEPSPGEPDHRSLARALVTGGDDSTEDSAIALGLAKSFGAKGNALGPGTGGGEGEPLGVSRGGGEVTFVRQRVSNVKRIVFLCDSSGSMMARFDTLRLELRKAIERLEPIQSFDVIFFSEDKHIALDKELLLARPEAKRRAYAFMDTVAAHGSSDPISGLRAAFAAGPELIFMLTDGDFPDNERLLAEIRRLNKDKGVKVNTIAFMEHGASYERLLKRVADENGGSFKFVEERELQ